MIMHEECLEGNYRSVEKLRTSGPGVGIHQHKRELAVMMMMTHRRMMGGQWSRPIKAEVEEIRRTSSCISGDDSKRVNTRSSNQFEFEAAARNVAEAGKSSSRASDDDENGINTRKTQII
ncbi:hypothetical protein OROMI_027305 [Orobanche minor]